MSIRIRIELPMKKLERVTRSKLNLITSGLSPVIGQGQRIPHDIVRLSDGVCKKSKYIPMRFVLIAPTEEERQLIELKWDDIRSLIGRIFKSDHSVIVQSE